MGPTGSGKSELVKSGLRARCFPMRMHIIDPKDEYGHMGYIRVHPRDMAAAGNPVTFKTRSIPDSDEEIEQALAICHARRRCWILAEECADYKNSEELGKILRRGRSAGVHALCTTQRPAEIGRTVTSQAAVTVSYRCEEPRDLEYYRQRYGKDFEAQMETLPRYCFIVKGDEELFYHYFPDAHEKSVDRGRRT